MTVSLRISMEVKGIPCDFTIDNINPTLKYREVILSMLREVIMLVDDMKKLSEENKT